MRSTKTGSAPAKETDPVQASPVMRGTRPRNSSSCASGVNVHHTTAYYLARTLARTVALGTVAIGAAYGVAGLIALAYRAPVWFPAAVTAAGVGAVVGLGRKVRT